METLGRFITFEGGEFVGKSTIATECFVKVLDDLGMNARTSREPGGTPEGEAIREEIFARLKAKAPVEELVGLFYRARRLHLDSVILPFLGEQRDRDGVMILDRYVDSSIVLQGMEGGVPLEKFVELNKEQALGFYPDMTVIMYFPEEKFEPVFNLRKLHAASKDAKRSITEWDKGSIELQLRRQRQYCSLPQTYERLGVARQFAFVDASQHPREVLLSCLRVVSPLFANRYSYEDMLESYTRLSRNGVWNPLDTVWNEQQQLQYANA